MLLAFTLAYLKPWVTNLSRLLIARTVADPLSYSRSSTYIERPERNTYIHILTTIFIVGSCVRLKGTLTWLDGVPKGKLPPRASWIVVGHEMQPLPMLGNIREPDIQEGLRSSRTQDFWNKDRGGGFAHNSTMVGRFRRHQAPESGSIAFISSINN